MESDQHQDDIERVLCGEVPADEPRFVHALERDPALRERWERLRALTSTLDSMGAAERAARFEPAAPFERAAPGETALAMPEVEERVAQIVRRHFERRPNGAPRPRWFWGTLLAAGLAWTLWLITDTDPAATPATFGAPGLEPDHAALVLGEGDAVLSGLSALELGQGSFRLDWADARPSLGRTYFVRIHQRDGEVLGATLEALGSAELSSPPWTFTVPAGYDPRQLGWSVEVRDEDRNPVATSAVQAFPSP